MGGAGKGKGTRGGIGVGDGGVKRGNNDER